MKEITTAIVILAAAHLFCVPALDDIKAENTLPIVKVEVEDDKPATKGVIELQLADWCGPCRKFKAAGIITELEKAGWTVEYNNDMSRKYPTFRVTIDGKSKTWSGSHRPSPPRSQPCGPTQHQSSGHPTGRHPNLWQPPPQGPRGYA